MRGREVGRRVKRRVTVSNSLSSSFPAPVLALVCPFRSVHLILSVIRERETLELAALVGLAFCFFSSKTMSAYLLTSSSFLLQMTKTPPVDDEDEGYENDSDSNSGSGNVRMTLTS